MNIRLRPHRGCSLQSQFCAVDERGNTPRSSFANGAATMETSTPCTDTPLRQRVVKDMRMCKLEDKTQQGL